MEIHIWKLRHRLFFPSNSSLVIMIPTTFSPRKGGGMRSKGIFPIRREGGLTVLMFPLGSLLRPNPFSLSLSRSQSTGS
jgi:hypothetical protein